MPLVSIVIAVYNVEKYLKACLDSVLAQTYENLQIICVNDGSTDSSPKILDEYAQKDSRIEIITQNNQGLATARNNGMQRVKGEYCCFLDSDDRYHADFVKYLLHLCQKYDADIADCQTIKSAKQEKTLKEKCIVTSKPLDLLLANKSLKIRNMVWTRMYKTALIKDLRFIDGICYEDYPWTACLMSLKPKVVISNQRLHYYTNNPTSITKSKFTYKKCHDYIIGLQYIYNFFNAHNTDLEVLKNRIIPTILKTQLSRLKNADEDVVKAFVEQLKWCKEHHLLSLWHNRWSRLWSYNRLMKKYA